LLEKAASIRQACELILAGERFGCLARMSEIDNSSIRENQTNETDNNQHHRRFVELPTLMSLCKFLEHFEKIEIDSEAAEGCRKTTSWAVQEGRGKSSLSGAHRPTLTERH
jgi:hypothetical protein